MTTEPNTAEVAAPVLGNVDDLSFMLRAAPDLIYSHHDGESDDVAAILQAASGHPQGWFLLAVALACLCRPTPTSRISEALVIKVDESTGQTSRVDMTAVPPPDRRAVQIIVAMAQGNADQAWKAWNKVDTVDRRHVLQMLTIAAHNQLFGEDVDGDGHGCPE